MFKRKRAVDENTAMRDALVTAYGNLAPTTQAKVDAAAKAKGYSQGYLAMVQLFWKHKVFPFLARAYYGPQEGLVNFIEKIKRAFGGLFKGSTAQDTSSDRDAFHALFEDPSGADGLVKLFDDLGRMAEQSSLKEEEATQAIQGLISGSDSVNNSALDLGQRR